MISNQHNLSQEVQSSGKFGIKFSLYSEDTFNLILGKGWSSYRWYNSEKERDKALIELRREHEYSRLGDKPRIFLEPVSSD